MPVHIWHPTNPDGNPFQNNGEVTYVCEGEWDFAVQVDRLEKWVEENKDSLTKGRYVADVGFRLREGATGGGPTLSIEFMKVLVEIGMELFFSEYDD